MQYITTYWREILAILSVVIGIFGYVGYFQSIFAGKTKPHLYSWGTWTFVGVVAAVAQFYGGGGVGTSMLAFTAVVCGMVTFLAFRYGERSGDRIDIASVILAVLAIVVWLSTDNPLYATILVTFADLLAYIPTLRKLWGSPQSESVLFYILSSIKHGLALASLMTYSFTTMLFSSSVIMINFIIFFLIFFHKK